MRSLSHLFFLAIIISTAFLSCNTSDKKPEFINFLNLDFGEGVYRPNPFRLLDSIPPFSWIGMPDSVKKETELKIFFNEDAVRSHSSGQLAFIDVNGNRINGIAIGNQGKNSILLNANINPITIPVRFTVNPIIGDSVLTGSIVILGNELDEVNTTKLESTFTPVASWSIKHVVGINWWRWFLLIVIVLIALYLLYLVSGLIYRAIAIIIRSLFGRSLPSCKRHELSRVDKECNVKKSNKKKDKRKNKVMEELLRLEKRLYERIRVVDKYDVLEKMRIIIDDLYNNDRDTYLEVKNALRSNTWDALEECWKLWNPTPTNNVEWKGPNDRTCVLKSTNALYKDCKKLDFIKCTYDEHGSPDFDPVTFPGSIIDISDLYDTLSSENIQKRGGGSNSLQEIAQERMLKQLTNVVHKWAKQNNCVPDFYKWRDAHDLVPHEDTNCRTMRLVYRVPHTAFKHRGGVANALNIKRSFS